MPWPEPESRNGSIARGLPGFGLKANKSDCGGWHGGCTASYSVRAQCSLRVKAWILGVFELFAVRLSNTWARQRRMSVGRGVKFRFLNHELSYIYIDREPMYQRSSHERLRDRCRSLGFAVVVEVSIFGGSAPSKVSSTLNLELPATSNPEVLNAICRRLSR